MHIKCIELKWWCNHLYVVLITTYSRWITHDIEFSHIICSKIRYHKHYIYRLLKIVTLWIVHYNLQTHVLASIHYNYITKFLYTMLVIWQPTDSLTHNLHRKFEGLLHIQQKKWCYINWCCHFNKSLTRTKNWLSLICYIWASDADC